MYMHLTFGDHIFIIDVFHPGAAAAGVFDDFGLWKTPQGDFVTRSVVPPEFIMGCMVRRHP